MSVDYFCANREVPGLTLSSTVSKGSNMALGLSSGRPRNHAGARKPRHRPPLSVHDLPLGIAGAAAPVDDLAGRDQPPLLHRAKEVGGKLEGDEALSLFQRRGHR